MDLQKLLGERIRTLRTDIGLSQEELAFRCDMQVPHIGLIERGEGNPSLETLNKIANGFQITVSELLNFDQPPEVPDYGEAINKVVSWMKAMTPEQQNQVLSIIKILSK